MNTFSHVPPGFRFHPTDEELVDYYLRKKVSSKKIDLDVIKDVDLYKIEPWDLQELCKIGSDEQNDWYFFSHKDKKYPTGTRTNRATKAGFWKATGRDKAIYSKQFLVGMRKTLVFYKGRAPNGQKSDWIMHEYRLETNQNGISQEEGWVVCRVFKKRMTTVQKMNEYDQSPCNWYDDQVSFMPDLESPTRTNSHPPNYTSYHSCKPELELMQYNTPHQYHDASFLQLPHLESPKITQSIIPYNHHAHANNNNIALTQHQQQQQMQYFQYHQQNLHSLYGGNSSNGNDEQVTDWRVLDKFVASQLSHEENNNNNNNNNNQDHVSNKEASSFSNAAILHVAEQITLLDNGSKKNEVSEEHASTSTSSCHMELWK